MFQPTTKGFKINTEQDLDNNNKTVCVISLIVFTDKYKAHVKVIYTKMVIHYIIIIY